MSDDESNSQAGKLDAIEQEAIQLLAAFKIFLRKAADGHVCLSPYEKVTSPRENKSQSSVYFPRSYLPKLREQLQSGVAPHSTLRGIIAPSSGYVEIVVQTSVIMGSGMRLRRASIGADITCPHIETDDRVPTLQREGHWQVDLHIPGTDGVCVEISAASPACHALTSYGNYGPRDRWGPVNTTVKVYADEADKNKLEKFADKIVASLLYELDIRNAIQFRVNRWLSERGDRRILQRRTTTSVVRFPEISIKPDMATLFTFAASALDNPPLAFLSYYQILEHNLALAVKRRALRKLGKELSDPLFDRSNRDDLLRIYMIGERSTHMSEAVQLRTLIDECVRAETLTDFFSGDYLQSLRKEGSDHWS